MTDSMTPGSVPATERHSPPGSAACPECGSATRVGTTCPCGHYQRSEPTLDKAAFRADFEAFLAETGRALNDDGCLIPANTKGDGRPCECPCHTEGRHNPSAGVS